MRIAIIHDQWRRSGGIERYLCDVVNELARRGDSIDLYVFRGDKTLSLPDGVRLFIKKIPFLSGRLAKQLFYWRMNCFFKRNEYDLVISLTRTHCQDMYISGGPHAGFLRRMNKRISSYHRRECLAEQRAIATSRVVVAHSELIKSDILHDYKVAADKVQVLYPPSSADRFYFADAAYCQKAREKFKLPMDKTILLFPAVGSAQRKGLDIFLAVCRKLAADNFVGVLVGSGLQVDLPENCKSLGYVEDMRDVYALSDITVLPARYEPFGLVVPESLQCGTAVIVSKNVGAGELLSSSDGIIVAENTVAEFVSACKKMQQQRFIPEDNFIAAHDLRVEQHVSKLLSLI